MTTPVAAMIVLLAGCSSTGGDSPGAGAQDSPAPASTPQSPTTESTGPPPTSGPVHALGDQVRLPTGSDVTAYSWQRVRRPGPAADGSWWAADVGFCITEDLGDFEEPVTNILSQFRVELPDGTALEPDMHARRPTETYARRGLVFVAEQCRRGEMVFDVPDGTAAKYLAITLSSFGWPRWRLT